ncbi:hypothetical protein ACFQ4K_15190 [Tistrella bauzanensis]
MVGAAVIIGSAIYITRREARLAGRPVTPIAAEPPDPETEDRSR